MENFSENSESLLVSTTIPINRDIESIWSRAGQLRSVPFITHDGHLSLHSSFLWKFSLVIHDLNPRMGHLHAICKLIVSNNSPRLETQNNMSAFPQSQDCRFPVFPFLCGSIHRMFFLIFSSFFFHSLFPYFLSLWAHWSCFPLQNTDFTNRYCQ